MIGFGKFTLTAFTAAIALFAFSAPAQAQHLDRWETRRFARHIEERSDELFDRIDDWIAERHDERWARVQDLYPHIDRFVIALDDYKSQLLQHDDPWEVRDQAEAVVRAGDALGRHLQEAGYLPPDLRDHWHDVHEALRDFAHQYHIDVQGEGVAP
ncbi:MAG TPA: hypothetical protein VL992_05570 [Tepidisphaeraceae bacterium]|nr:hypothetical protein [Tepidisphaeraceae bacterium]